MLSYIYIQLEISRYYLSLKHSLRTLSRSFILLSRRMAVICLMALRIRNWRRREWKLMAVVSLILERKKKAFHNRNAYLQTNSSEQDVSSIQMFTHCAIIHF